MREFLLKDFHLHRRFILGLGILFPLYVGYMSSRIFSPRVFALMSAFMYAIVALLLYTREDRFKAVGLSVSLPATRRRVILGRYLMCWVLMGGLWMLGAGISLLWPGPGLRTADLVGIGAILVALSYMTAFLALFQPLTIQFGPAGVMGFLVAMQVLGIVATMFRFRLQTLKVLVGSVGRGVAWAQGALGPAGAAAGILAVLILVNYLSFELSILFFKRKEF